MNTKFNKILSVLATVAIVASSFVWALPVAASAPGDGTFTNQDIPAAGAAGKNVLLGGSGIRDIAVGADGKTIYVAHAPAPAAVGDTIQVVVTSNTQTGAVTGWSAIGGTYNLNYVDQAGAASVSTNFAIPALTPRGTVIAGVIAPDTGVRQVTGVTIVVAGAVTDSFHVVGVTTGYSFATYTDSAVPVFTAGVNMAAFGAFSIYKSTDAGQSFDAVLNNYAGAAPVAIAVAPDDVNTVAVTDGALVIISKDGGTTWATLPALPAFYAGARITDIAVAPARSGTLLGREYVVSVADPGAALVAQGDVLIIGNTATWASVATGITGTRDYTSVKVTPNFLGDRCVVAVGTIAGATNVATTAFQIFNTATTAVQQTCTLVAAGVASTTINYDGAAAPGANSILSSSIALPTNFDPTTTSGRRAYVGIASVAPTTDNDVYRCDDNAAKKLDAVSAAPISSVAYNGTNDTGILFAGLRNTNGNGGADVKYTTGMSSSSPTWTTTLKAPSGASAAPAPVLAVASDYATSSTVFAGTMGAEAGFSVSKDAGVSFVQEALIDTGTGLGTPTLSFTGDAKTVFLCATDGNNYATIWQSAVPFDPASWKRIFARPKGIPGSGLALSLNPGWTTTPAMFLFESTTVNGPIYVSQDAGVSFVLRNSPTGVGRAASGVRDAQTVYFGDTAGAFYKSTNACWTWTTAVPTGIGGAITMFLAPKANQIIASGASITITNDDGLTFTALGTALPPGTMYVTIMDTNYATNNILYAADIIPAGASIYRINTSSTSNTWELLATPQGGANRILGLGTRSGVLYATSNSAAVGICRTLTPTDLVGQQNWQTVFNGLTGAPSTGVGTTVGTNLWARVGNAILAFNDFLATNKPTLTAPADNYNDAVNPSGGNGYPVDIKWQAMGTGAGLVTFADVEIVDKANGFTGTPTWPAVAAGTNPVLVATGPAAAAGSAFQPNKSYLFRVRARAIGSGQVIDSPWSDARTINIQAGSIVSQEYAGPVLLGPQGGAQNLDPNLIGFAWAPVSGATEYTVIVATDPALTKAVSGTPAKVTVPAYQATGLAYGTTYFWAVQATKPTSSVQTMGTFTTMQKPVAAPTATAAPVQPTIIVQAPVAETPSYIWAVIAIGAILVIAVIILIVRTRRVP